MRPDPVISSISAWVSSRPDSDEINQALTELQDLIVFAKIHGVYVGSASLQKLLRWVYVAGQIPMEWLEAEMRELNGIKR